MDAPDTRGARGAALALGAALAWALWRLAPAGTAGRPGPGTPALVLSLARHGHRRRRLAAQATGLTFVDAVDGAKLAEPTPGLTRGETGCFLSHAGAWLRLAQGGEPVALVLEDDADVRLPDAWAAIAEAADRAPPDWDVLYLGHNNQPAPAEPGVVDPVGDVHGTHALLLTRAGARKLLDRYAADGGRGADGRGLPVDVWMSRVPGLRRYCVAPQLVHPFDLGDSETQRVA